MNRRWQWLNLGGVLVLAIFCIFQWRRDRSLNLDYNQLEKTRLAQQEKISEQDKNIRGLTDDLALFKDQLGRAQSELGDSRKKISELERTNEQLLSDREQLKASITNWVSAVALRDERLKEANGRIQDLANQLNASIQKFNELATNYNAIVKDVNNLRGGKTNLATNTAPR